MNSKKIFLLSLVIIGVLAINSIALADTSVLSLSPSSASKTAGTPFNVSLQINPAGNNVCVVKGTLDLNNLSCQSINITSDVMAQKTPTCSSPSFILGIPKCSTVAQSLFTMSVKGIKAGQGTLALAGIKVIGAGTDIASSSQGGTYNITVIPTEPTKTTTTEITATQPTQSTIQPLSPTNQQQDQQNNIPENYGTAALTTNSSNLINYFWIIFGIIAVLVAGYSIYYFRSRKEQI